MAEDDMNPSEPNFNSDVEVEVEVEGDENNLFNQGSNSTKKIESKKRFIKPLFLSIVLIITIIFAYFQTANNAENATEIDETTLNNTDVFVQEQGYYAPTATLPEYETSSEIEDTPHSNIVDESLSDTDDVSEGFNTLILETLTKLNETNQDINNYLKVIDLSQKNILQKVENNEKVIKREILFVKNALKRLSQEGIDRDLALSKLATSVEGFEVDIKEQRYSFPLEILHVEEWSGRIRVIAYDISSPKNILKINIGTDYKSWILVDANNSKAQFKHSESKEVLEITL